MTASTIEKHKLLLDFLGEEKVLELYDIYGNERVSFATIKSLIDKEKIFNDLEKKQSISQVAKKHGVQRTTIYRLLKKVAAFKKLQQGVGL